MGNTHKDTRSAPRVSVIVVNWNTADLTIDCINSLMNGELTPSRILVWDNGSGPESADRIEKSCPNVEIIRNNTNVGFAAANNECIKRLTAGGADYIWVLNNDTIVAPDCLNIFVDYMEQHPHVMVTTGKILYAGDKKRIWYAGGALNRLTLASRHYGQNKLDSEKFSSEMTVTFVSGCCMFTRATVWQDVGLFNPKFFAYLEDQEWCMRAAMRKIVMRYLPNALIWHRISASITKNMLHQSGGRISPFAHYLTARNEIFIIRQYCKGISRLVLTSLNACLHHALIFAGLMLFFRRDKIISRLKGIVDGIRYDYN